MRLGINKLMVSNFFSLVVYQGVNYLMPLVAFPFLFRMLGDEYFGLFSFAWAVVQTLVMLTDFGFNLSGTKYISMHKEDTSLVNTHLNCIYIARLCLVIVCFFSLWVLTRVVPRFEDHATFFLLFYGVIIGNFLSPLYFFQGIEKMKYFTLFNLLAKTLTFVPIFFFIRGIGDYLWIPVFFSIGYIISGSISLYITYKKEKMRWFVPPLKEIYRVFKDSSTYFLSRLSTSLFTTVNVLVLGMATSYEMVSYYSRAEKIYQAYNLLLSPITGVLFPHMSKTRDVSFFKRLFSRITPINILLVLLLIIGGKLLLTTIYADSSEESILIFRILICASFVTIPSMLLGYPFLAAMGHATYTNMTILIVAFMHMAGVLLLYGLGFLSIYTMAAMMVISEVFLLLLRVRGVTKYELFK